MVQVMLRLQNHGKKNHPYWWIVVQPRNKHFQGRILEKVGIWAPRKTKTVDRMISLNTYKIKYWLSVGAQPTNSVHRLLNFAGILPKRPVPFGSSTVYPAKTKTYSLQYFHKHRWGLQDSTTSSTHHYEKIKRMESLLRAKLSLDMEAMNEIVRPRDLVSKYKTNNKEYNSDMNTDDINSDDFEFYSRKRNFDLISKKLDKYFQDKYKLYRGNDYQYNNYLRKLEKLSKHESLDYEGFKDYLQAVGKFKESKDIVLENIGNHFLNELIMKENLHKEIEELIKLSKIGEDKPDKDINQLGLEEPAPQNNESTLPPSYLNSIYVSSSRKDIDSLFNSLNKGFEKAAKETFKLSEHENFNSSEFIDIKNLRIAKLLIKLRLTILDKYNQINKQQAEENSPEEKKIYRETVSSQKENNEISSFIDKPSEDNLLSDPQLNSSFFNSIFENLKYSDAQDIPLFDKELYFQIISKIGKNPSTYDDMLFENINNFLLSTETFQKFKPLLFHPEFYGIENLNSNEKSKILMNPNIYLINNDLIDELITSLLGKLKKKYDINEIYNDELRDLDNFESEEKINLKRRIEMEKTLVELKQKHGNFNLLYDDYRGKTDELKADLIKFKEDYRGDLEAKYDLKFKQDLRIVKPEFNLTKYDTQEDIEKELAREEKFDRIKERVKNEIQCKKIGIEYVPTEAETKEISELNEEEKKFEDGIRQEYSIKLLGPEDEFEAIFPLPDENRPLIDFNPYINMLRYKYKKQPKNPNQDEIMLLNRRKLRYNKIMANSVQETRAITRSRQLEIKKRFIEYFGKYNNMMYPEGFRHYETFEVYNAVYRFKTVADYQTELHSFCNFDTFVLVCYGLINQYKKIALLGLEFPELFSKVEYLVLYLKSKNTEFITHTLKDTYKSLVHEHEDRNLRFKLIDALEIASAKNLPDCVLPELKILLDIDIDEQIGGSPLITNFQQMKMTDLSERGEDLGLSRVSPFMPINPLKAHKANPVFNTPRVWKQNKVHLSGARTRLYKGFCTSTCKLELNKYI